MRDAGVAALTALFALFLKIFKGHLTWGVSKQNALEAQFPIVAVVAVFFAFHVIKATRSLIKDVRAESEIAYNPFPSLVLPSSETITVMKKNDVLGYRIRIIAMACVITLALAALSVLSWKATDLAFQVQAAETTQHSTSQPTAPPASLPKPSSSVAPSSKRRSPKRTTKEPCSAEDRLLGRC